jgi:hypothetical protein
MGEDGDPREKLVCKLVQGDFDTFKAQLSYLCFWKVSSSLVSFHCKAAAVRFFKIDRCCPVPSKQQKGEF